VKLLNLDHQQRIETLRMYLCLMTSYQKTESGAHDLFLPLALGGPNIELKGTGGRGDAQQI
jgi:hypothetical protein